MDTPAFWSQTSWLSSWSLWGSGSCSPQSRMQVQWSWHNLRVYSKIIFLIFSWCCMMLKKKITLISLYLNNKESKEIGKICDTNSVSHNTCFSLFTNAFHVSNIISMSLKICFYLKERITQTVDLGFSAPQ